MNIDAILRLLDWKQSEENQIKGLRMAKEVQCIKAFFRPITQWASKGLWDNCALVIAERSDTELKPYAQEMLLWLEDMNWPGAEIIQQRLLRMEDDDTIKDIAAHIDDRVSAFVALQKTDWLWPIAQLLTNRKIRSALKEKTLRCLEEIQLLYCTD